jgi:hypothetical protein
MGLIRDSNGAASLQQSRFEPVTMDLADHIMASN